ncbi:MerR family transcriptional regulator [Amycolatopsis suaedae]|uniref:MerR family transcriptional regulator n=1 Tax=Amycolatopsis suaedae TaxID=2510978 RepID=A0A4Q7J1B1_9PSEU|nr:MerR family transcriptional regulator [Amycolatopsis suaedae]RZQ61180.1 MerR family transcriptional regulator [Amycolatopsis suaedae]
MDTLVPVREVADHFGLAISTLHYWERRGLVTPYRRSGQRFYDTEQLYRVAVIKLWRQTGMLSLDRIARLLTSGDGWRATVAAQLAEIEAERARLDAAHGYLSRLATCRYAENVEHCPEFRAGVELPGRAQRRGMATAATTAAAARQQAEAANAAV